MKNGFDRIVARATWTKSIEVGRQLSFPLNPQDKQEELHEVLMLLWNVLMGPKHHIYQLYPLF
jgi:hypothetical protein